MSRGFSSLPEVRLLRSSKLRSRVRLVSCCCSSRGLYRSTRRPGKFSFLVWLALALVNVRLGDDKNSSISQLFSQLQSLPNLIHIVFMYMYGKNSKPFHFTNLFSKFLFSPTAGLLFALPQVSMDSSRPPLASNGRLVALLCSSSLKGIQ